MKMAQFEVDGFLVVAFSGIPKPDYARKAASNASGTMVYPGPPPNYDLIPSMRLANLRDGMEDYEYLFMLRERLKRLDPRKHASLVQQAKHALAISPDIIDTVYKWTQRAAVLNRRRADLARLIRHVSAQR